MKTSDIAAEITEQNQSGAPMPANDADRSRRDFASKLTLLENEALRLGLYRTRGRINDAVVELGWELAGVPVPDSRKEQMYAYTPGVK